ncbi:MAG: hypothetical protein U1B78_04335 [Dehalococcoidia bacterium]|nr:hypothetical protein [Dehalococcoidia bacterium]
MSDEQADPQPIWRQALDDLERSLRDASRAIGMLRHSLEMEDLRAGPVSAAAPAMPAPAAPEQPPDPAAPEGDDAEVENGSRASPFERLWERIEHERLEKQQEAPDAAPKRRGLDALPQQYLVTVEDKEHEVDLVPLHRAFLNVAGMDEVSLVSFANGVPVISLRVEGELDFDRLSEAVGTTMGRQCEAIPQENNRLHLRLKARED